MGNYLLQGLFLPPLVGGNGYQPHQVQQRELRLKYQHRRAVFIKD